MFIDGLAAVAGDFDAFLLDQWGVLHDGHYAFAPALDALRRLRALGKRVVLLSNTARREADNVRMLARLGVDPSLFDAIVTAGDDAREALASADDPAYRRLGPNCLPLSRPRDRELAQARPGMRLVDDVERADWVFLLSTEPPEVSLAGWKALLERAAERQLPMVCANPDLDRVTPEGVLLEAPGRVALYYEELGGHVLWHGKPEPRVYATALERLGVAGPRCLAVGDSLAHDVRGACRAGLASAWIAAGIHAAEAGLDAAGALDRQRCLELFRRQDLHPDYALTRMCW